MAARPRRSRATRAALSLVLGLALGLGLACSIVAWLVCGSVHQPARLLGVTNAVRARITLGSLLSSALGREGVLLVGDSRIEALPSPSSSDRAPRFVVNAGVSGTSAHAWLELLPSQTADGSRYGAAVWWAGVNDLLYGTASEAAVADDVSRIALRLRHHARRVLVLEQSPVRLDSVARSRSLDARLVAVNLRVAERLAREPGLSVLAIHDRLRDADGQLARWCSDDGLHLNASGNAWLVQRMREAQAR